MSLGQAHSLHLKRFALSRTAALGNPVAQLVSTPLVTYLSTPALTTGVSDTGIQHITFPIVVDSHGAPWPEACLFLASKFYDDKRHIRTCVSLAKDLALYLRYLNEEHLSFRFFPSERYKRVTYRYRAYLKLKMDAGEITIKTARRKISCVISFYKWLAEHKKFIPDNPPWKEKQTLIPVNEEGKKDKHRVVTTTDLAFKGADPVDIALITDGGRLRPLQDAQQIKLLETLYLLGNSEMYLAHILALFSGARIQTVLTIRAEHITSCERGPNNCAYIKVGPGTGVDTKLNKRYVLLVPWEVIEKLRLYINSGRYQSRVKAATGDRFKGMEYLFLSNRGTPYYQSIQDPGCNDKLISLEGAAVRQFISDRVRPALKIDHEVFSYRFHDLRASFAMNIYNSLSSLSGKEKLSDSYIREYIRFRLGHATKKALDSYMSYAENNKVALQAQLDWERRLDLLAGWRVEDYQ
ncbi:MAG TPA: hypothetical protein DCR78_14375 [Pseudomonas sp.]|jgi:hypothetical protein|uniref:site-specific integrase n=1 Tax=Stutzerimonas xanthomarina TaxID=271420 RepID=UPI000E8675D8|nr:site-specific integrase [Stutzerimonas xanthomarina]MBU1458131.1 hypothetical protein [Gammaproteobacteria bacterium]HAQ87612.1 hypothetical protein [Pseudomonas sp.]MBK3847922.1 hypothetical protein [Stutzerimonas xanthomarina]MBU2372366.1 hypothetical protein [Gammaproteobacteria bacterium]HAW24285.1 hypothetical protein [Pseudomonas sp.]|tara:strand:+ start:76 stop:1473 length:1398 start_codon:yes stop_codon:yes gene_type:complete